MSLDFDKIKAAAEGYKADMTAFLREIIRIPSESAQEGDKAKRIQKQMDALGFTKTWIDPLGNVMGWMGTGPKVICFDGHIDTV
ncbi:MAG: YgeY family selenium metabolism-linked hydrolase, partial [Treponema sp.]